MASGQEPLAPQSPQRDTSEGKRVEVSTHRRPNDARPEHGALARREYGLLAPKEPAGNPAAAEPQGSGDSPENTTCTGETDRRETRTGEQNRQCALLACGQMEDKDKE